MKWLIRKILKTILWTGMIVLIGSFLINHFSPLITIILIMTIMVSILTIIEFISPGFVFDEPKTKDRIYDAAQPYTPSSDEKEQDQTLVL